MKSAEFDFEDSAEVQLPVYRTWARNNVPEVRDQLISQIGAEAISDRAISGADLLLFDREGILPEKFQKIQSPEDSLTLGD